MKVEQSRWNLRATYTQELRVEDAPPTTGWLGGQAIQPHIVTISYEYPDRQFTTPRAHVYGRNILKGGGLGVERRLDFYIAFDKWPEWVRELVTKHEPNWDEVLAKGTPE